MTISGVGQRQLLMEVRCMVLLVQILHSILAGMAYTTLKLLVSGLLIIYSMVHCQTHQFQLSKHVKGVSMITTNHISYELDWAMERYKSKNKTSGISVI
jgi:hypothetical protein